MGKMHHLLATLCLFFVGVSEIYAGSMLTDKLVLAQKQLLMEQERNKRLEALKHVVSDPQLRLQYLENLNKLFVHESRLVKTREQTTQEMASAVNKMDTHTLESLHQEVFVRHAALKNLDQQTKNAATSSRLRAHFGQWSPENFAVRNDRKFPTIDDAPILPSMLPAGIRQHWAYKEAPRLRQNFAQGGMGAISAIDGEDPEATMNEFMLFRMAARQDVSGESPEVGATDMLLQNTAMRAQKIGDIPEVSSNDIHEQARLKRLS